MTTYNDYLYNEEVYNIHPIRYIISYVKSLINKIKLIIHGRWSEEFLISVITSGVLRRIAPSSVLFNILFRLDNVFRGSRYVEFDLIVSVIQSNLKKSKAYIRYILLELIQLRKLVRNISIIRGYILYITFAWYHRVENTIEFSNILYIINKIHIYTRYIRINNISTKLSLVLSRRLYNFSRKMAIRYIFIIYKRVNYTGIFRSVISLISSIIKIYGSNVIIKLVVRRVCSLIGLKYGVIEEQRNTKFLGREYVVDIKIIYERDY